MDDILFGGGTFIDSFPPVLENAADYRPKEISPETEQRCNRLWELYIALKVTGDYENVAAYKSV